MKKIALSIMALAMAALTFTSCEDVPAPYDYPGTGGGDTDVPAGEATGTGTEADPFNCLAAINYTSSLDADVESSEDVYIKGKVVSVDEEFTTNYGNASFTISEDGTKNNTFKVWRALYIGNKKYTDGQEQIKVGDEVVVCGKVINYKGNTPETVQGKAYLYSLNGNGGSSDTPVVDEGEATGNGTVDNPYNSVAANKYIATLGKDTESDKEIYVKGKVVSVKEQYGTQYGNATFYISDNGKAEGQFYVFRALYLGNKKYTSGATLKEGDEVVVCGKVINYYGNTPETVQGKAYLYSLNGKTVAEEGSGDQPGGEEKPGEEVTPGGGEVSGNTLTVTAASLGVADKTAMPTVTLTDGTTLSFDGGGNANVPKYYNTGASIRMYPKNSMTVTATKNIAKIEFEVDVYNNDTYNASGDISAEPGTVSTNAANVIISDISAKTTKITDVSATTGAPSQLRVKTIKITYAE